MMDPEGLEEVMGIGVFGGVELFNPLLGGGDDFFGVAAAEFDVGALANAIDGMFEIFEERGNGESGDGYGFLEGAIFVDEAIDASVGVVAVGVTDIVLHVTDDEVLPIGDVEGAIGTEDGVGGAEIFVIAFEEIVGWGAPDLAKAEGFVAIGEAFAVELVVFDAEVADGIEDEEILLELFGEVFAGDDGVCGDWADLHFQELLHFEAIA